MDAMVLQLEPVAQSSFKQYGPWHYRDQQYTEGGRMEFGETLLQVAPAVTVLDTDFLKTEPRNPRPLTPGAQSPGHEDEDCLLESPSTASTDFPSPNYGLSSTPIQSPVGISWLSSRSLELASAFSFTQAIPPVGQVFDFSKMPQPHKPQLSVKRRRAASDVDGPNTASQGCKKRRLRRYMVTSRLSRPFSEPATHIINREFIASGDNQFLKLAAILSARRMSSAASTLLHQISHHSPSSLLRRAAVINRFRLNVKSRATQRGDDDVADLATNAAMLQQNHGVAFVVGARFPVTSSSAPLLAGSGSSGLRDAQQSVLPFQLSLAAVEARPRPKSPRLKATEASRLKLPPSPRIMPVPTPELSSTRSFYLADLHDDEGIDDQEVAFPTSEHESRYESSDDPDDVYADFGIIFGGGNAEDECEDEEEDHYEDYMDDMDGIPWTAR
ncbi:hypothetical protein CONLIGDRAFT_677903 [Coniochaeta ligniaria NRRL 30616]|uniref:Uncharacterized protein n=1 Tax=Coniochaeta ligniaria NRRL 30616 TaxID=1408157 RepID=A0A1J7JLD9_9PEZI|nr:hypothetical protein CONLIGDRAFT_677903 [Coniochaeta ligniaria NRRL 30616]